MQQTPETVTRGPPRPYIIGGQRFYNLRQAAQIIGTVSAVTLGNWAKNGYTTRDSDNFKLDARHVQSRILIPEERVFALKEILQAHPTRRGRLSIEEEVLLPSEVQNERLRRQHQHRMRLYRATYQPD